MVAATVCSSVSAACGARSSLDISSYEDAAVDSAVTADVSRPTETPPSCQAGGPGLTNCGASGESCCTSLEVPGGSFNRWYTNDGGGPTDELFPATVSGVRLDKYLVTVGRFRQFVAAWDGGWLPSAGSGKHTHLNEGNGLNATGGGYEPGWVTTDNGNIAPTNGSLGCSDSDATWTNTAGSQENLPINCVNWWEAYAFCIWDGGFLPSEAESEYAAAGGSSEREYPWGSTDPGTGNQYAIYDCYYPDGTGLCNGVRNIAPVGTATLGAARWGQLDMAGEEFEWNLDWFSTYVDPCIDCASLSSGSYRVIQGGSYGDVVSLLLPPSLDATSVRSFDVGFRCARAP